MLDVGVIPGSIGEVRQYAGDGGLGVRDGTGKGLLSSESTLGTIGGVC